MPTRSFGRSYRFGRPSGRRRLSGGQNYGSRNRFSSNGKKGFRDQSIDPTLFISQAKPAIKEKPYEPKNAFSDFIISQTLKDNISAKGYTTPTPIQDEAIPIVLQNRDIVGVANTGTGKTGAFLIPLINKVILNPRENILIIVPTRELAGQINQELIEFRGRLKIFSVCCVGGVSIYKQISDLRRNHNFVIGTPGRLKDLIDRKLINPQNFATLVLDEADRMLDMGFVHEIRYLVSLLAPKRQTLFFSATINKEVDKLIKEFLDNPVQISVKTGDTAKNVDQDVIKLNHDGEKIDVLHSLLAKPEFTKVLIFGKTKYGVEKLATNLIGKGFKADAIHGDKNQNKRQLALSQFKSNKTKILVATDVAARGLDIPNVSHVINYDIPATYDDYIHRIGRTGRGDQMGKALTFIS